MATMRESGCSMSRAQDVAGRAIQVGQRDEANFRDGAAPMIASGSNICGSLQVGQHELVDVYDFADDRLVFPSVYTCGF